MAAFDGASLRSPRGTTCMLPAVEGAERAQPGVRADGIAFRDDHMPTKTTTNKPAQSKPSAAKPPAAKSSAAKAPAARLSRSEVMGILEKLGTEQTRKTWARHGAKGPMFGVLFGELFKLMK